MNQLSQADYERMADAIAWIDSNYRDQPSTGDIAAAVGLSSAHFSRLFRRWAGLTPGRYVQHRTINDARSRLDKRASVLDAALDSGLSGPGRLHDLFVRIEAMSPGEYKSGGAGLELRVGFGSTPFGEAMLVRSARGIVELTFLQNENRKNFREQLATRWPHATLVDDPTAGDVLGRIFSGDDEVWVLNPAGTNFQLQVWRALLKIPAASASFYGAIAADIGRASASRAVGTAIGSNAIAWLIPCHRVLQKSGSLGGYKWGIERKATMLQWEDCQVLAGS